MSDVLAAALSRGGDYADLFFEHRQTSSILFEEQAVKNAGGGTVQGMGVRVVAGEATGYAYTEDLTPESMRQAAESAARIASRGGHPTPQAIRQRGVRDLYPVRSPSWETPARDKLAIIRRADVAARAFDPMIQRVVVSFGDEVKHIAVATSEGTFVEDFQPMIRLNVQCLSEKGSDRQTAVGGGGGRAVLSPNALEQTLAGVARIDLDEIRRRLASADLDVGEDAGAERHLLPDPDGLGRHALVEVAE